MRNRLGEYPMNNTEEKRTLLRAIETVRKQLRYSRDQLETLDLLERFDTLVTCLLKLNWAEIGERRND